MRTTGVRDGMQVARVFFCSAQKILEAKEPHILQRFCFSDFACPSATLTRRALRADCAVHTPYPFAHPALTLSR
jgi:hypothetical protein